MLSGWPFLPDVILPDPTTEDPRPHHHCMFPELPDSHECMLPPRQIKQLAKFLDGYLFRDAAHGQRRSLSAGEATGSLDNVHFGFVIAERDKSLKRSRNFRLTNGLYILSLSVSSTSLCATLHVVTTYNVIGDALYIWSAVS